MLKRFILLTFIYLSAATRLIADDAYHTYIRSQLSEQFSVTNGQWLSPDTEAQTNAALESDNLSISIQPSSGVETFNQVLDINASERRVNSWDAILRFPTTAPINESDNLLFIFWINNTDSLQRQHEMIFDFEILNHPNERPLYLSHTLKPGWQQWFLPVQINQAVDKGGARFQIHLGHIEGHFQLAGVAMLNFGDHYTLDQLPQSTFHLEYDGEEDDAPWRAIALDRIENIRTSPMTIKIVNRYNEPIEGARVSIDMLRHEFGFGSAISSDQFFADTYDARLYVQKLENLTGDGRSFNTVTLKNALKWPAWEDEHAWGSREQARQVITWFVERGVRVRGHNLLWPDWQKMPDDLQAHANDVSFLQSRIQNHIFDLAAFPGVRGFISEWDVLNEVQYHDDLSVAMGSSDIFIDCFSWAGSADPMALLYLNENNIITETNSNVSFTTIQSFLHTLQEAKAPIHGFGMQGHMSVNLKPPEKLLEIFDAFSHFNLDLSITEYDAVDVDKDIAADYMRDILIAAFSHPRMQNFVMWGFWDGAHWKNDSPIFYQNWSLKPSGQVFLDYVYEKWWTTDQGETNQFGHFQTDGFLGDYKISILLNGKETNKNIKLSRQQNEFTLKLDTDQTTIYYPNSFQLHPNAPNPFNGVTAMIYELPRDAHITINLYDVRGRHVQTLLNQQQIAGRHILRIDSEVLAAGVYYVHLRSGNIKRVRKILVLK